MLQQSSYAWYVHPNDSHTNGVLSRMGGGCEYIGEVRCGDKITRQLWKCSSAVVERLRASRADLRIKFLLFFRAVRLQRRG